ncbi:MAG: CDP-alcohol phosphatidyltransferase family protein [Gammaproteobacteria bacterium]
MVSIYELKPAFQSMLRPLCRYLANAGVTANQVTVAALILSLICAVAVAATGGARWALLSVPVVLFLRMALNAVDGMLAREHDMQTRRGAVLNELADVVSDSGLYLAFAFVNGLGATAVVAFAMTAVISEMTGVVAVQIGASRRYDGPMGKSDRAFLVGVVALALGLDLLSPAVWTWVFYVGAALAALTVFNRARRALNEAG